MVRVVLVIISKSSFGEGGKCKKREKEQKTRDAFHRNLIEKRV